MLKSIERASALDLCYIMQGFRQKESKTIYRRVRELTINKKKELFPSGAETPEGRELLVNLFMTIASCRPQKYGVYKHYAREELDEMIAHYEHDLCEAAEKADAEQLTRLAQTMYIFKTG